MKVLYAVPVEAAVPGSDLGGVIQSSEQIMIGLREAGHEAHFAKIRDIPTVGRTNTPDRKRYGPEEWSVGEGTGLPMHNVLGWKGEYYTTGVPSSLQAFIDFANTCDVVIWGALFGFKNKYTAGRSDWARMITEVTTPTVIMIRDDHLWKRQAWTSVFDDYVNGWSSVHSCGFDLSAGLKKPRGIVFSPHDVGIAMPPATKKKEMIYACHNYKSWKRLDRIVAAAPYTSVPIRVAGDGIELRYMRATDKCKPKYRATAHTDPDATPEMMGERIWDNAHKFGDFKYLETHTGPERDAWMRGCKWNIDLSNRKNTGQFNRVFIEAAIQGTVTLAYESFMSGENGDNLLWQPWVHYVPVPEDCTPSELGAFFDSLASFDMNLYDNIVCNVQDRLTMFDRKTAAQQLVQMALGKKPKGVWNYVKGGKGNEQLLKQGHEEFVEVFGELS